MKNKYVVWFNEVDKGDIDIVGGKGANLGEMTKAGFPVPNGFVVTAQAYYHFLDVTGIRSHIKDVLTGLDVDNSKALEKAAQEVQKIIVKAPFPEDIASLVIDYYFKLERRFLKHPLVAVRSSATAEDLPDASFAGQQSTFLNVEGEANVIEMVKEAWASLFTARAIFYRATNKFDHFKVGIAIPVQRMVESDASGIMFTIDPVTNDKTKVTIEAIHGLGEMIVQGAVTPDHYEVDKKDEEIIVKQLGGQEKKMVRKNGKNVILKLEKSESSKQKISDKEIIELARLGMKLEKHYYFPQDIEWAIEDGKVYIVQTRPITTIKEDKGEQKGVSIKEVTKHMTLIAKGDPASPGIASGKVQILRSAKEIDKVDKGEVLVAEQTNPDFVPAMKKAVAIVTERGGRTSHAAIVSRELGIPAVVGTGNAMSVLKNGQMITVSGSTGEVFKGAIDKNVKVMTGPATPHAQEKTATKVYMNLAEPDRVRELSRKNVEGVGLLRAEFMIAGIGTHPRKLIEDHKEKVFINSLAEQLSVFCENFDPRPVVYRATDFKTNEYRNLKGGKAFEPEEPNPMLGYRGAARYITDTRVFEMELEAIKEVRNKKGLKNLWLMIPFVRSPKELLEVKKLVAANGLLRSPSFKLWMMVEIPTNVINLDAFLEIGIDGVSIGSNDLTMLTLGTDRDNSEVAGAFNELDPSLLWSFERVIKTCDKWGVTSSMCGQAPSDYPELLEMLVKWGITSVSVNPDVVESVRESIYQAEHKIVSKR